MSEEEELKAFKIQALKRARMTSIVLGVAAVIAILFMMYGFTQSIEASKQRDISLTQERLLMECQKRADAAEQGLKTETERSIRLLEKIDSLTNANNRKTKK